MTTSTSTTGTRTSDTGTRTSDTGDGVGRVLDLVGIGIGPFNLGLACLTDPIDDLDAVFLDQADGFAWHHGMMLDDATIQVPFLADLVTMADPTSPFSFLAWLKETGRLYPFFIREDFHPLRVEYDAYCRWAAERLDTLRWGRRVVAVEHDEDTDLFTVLAETPSGSERYVARHVVLGIGTEPTVPEALRDLDGPVVHSAGYLPARDALRSADSIAVVGSGQSAAEVYRDLYRRRQVERAERRIGGDMQRRMAELQFVVGQAGALATEHDRHLGRFAGLGPGTARALVRRQLFQRDPARTRGAADHQGAIGHRLGQGGEDRRLAEHVLGTGRTPIGVFVERTLRRHQHQARHAHRLHRARGGADVAWMLGADKNETDALADGHERRLGSDSVVDGKLRGRLWCRTALLPSPFSILPSREL